MKSLIIYSFIFLPISLIAQVTIDRTHAPAPGPAPEIKIADPASFTLSNGLRIFVVQNNKLPRVAVTLTIDRDPVLEGNKAGMISMAGELIRRGTLKMNKATLDEEIDFLGASINVSATSVSGSSLKNNFPKLMELLADIALHPSFPADELEKIRKQEISNLDQQKDDPNAISEIVISRLIYGKNHPYGEVETDTTVRNVAVNDIRSYYNTYWKPNISYLVFVGDISPSEAKKLATKYFDEWQKADVPHIDYPWPPAPSRRQIALVDRPAAVQSVIQLGEVVSLKPGSPDDIPVSVTNNILGGGFSGRLFANLREKHGFTYGAYSKVNPDKFVGSFIADASVRNEKTDSSIAEFLYEIERIEKDSVEESELSRMKNYLAGNFARSLERPATIANFALNIARYQLPADYYQNYLKNLASVNTAQVQQMALKYIHPGQLQIVIVGNAKQIGQGLGKYGEVKYFDNYGNEIAPPVNKKIDPSITGPSIIQKYIEAVGGTKAISSIRDIEITGSVSFMGQNLDFDQKSILPGSFVQSITMKGSILQKELLKGGKYSVLAQGAEQPIKDETREQINEDAAVVTEVYQLQTPGYGFTVKGIEQLDGKDVYAVEVKRPSGKISTNYYDLSSGLKVKDAKEEDGGPAGKIVIQNYYKEYKSYNGVLLPVKTTIDQGQVKLDLVVSDVKLNTGLKQDDIK